MSLSTPLVIIAMALVIVVVLPRRDVPSSIVQQLRVLVPSWRFFDGLGVAPEMRMRVGPTSAQLGPWLPVIEVPRRSLRQLFWNPDGNHALACHTLIERLQHDLDDNPGVPPESLLSYQLVLDLARSAVPAEARGGVVQFQLHDREIVDDTRTLLLESGVHAC